MTSFEKHINGPQPEDVEMALKAKSQTIGEMMVDSVKDIKTAEPKIEYLVLAVRTNKILHQTFDWGEAVKVANFGRRAGGQVTIFKSTRG